MRYRRLRAALVATALAAGAVVVTAAPGYADDSCATAVPLAGNGAGLIGGGDYTDYWAYDATVPGTYRFTISRPALSGVSLYVLDNGCADTLCSVSPSASPAYCETVVAVPTTLKVMVYSGSGTQTGYTVSGAYRPPMTLPTQCGDSADNDGDGWTDTADSGCAGPLDTSEGAAEPCPSVGGIVACVSLTATGNEVTRLNAYGPEVTSVQVVAAVDLYQFSLPGGAKANVPCVIVVGAANPCADLGGAFFGRVLALAPVNAPLVDPLLDEPLTTVGLCEARLTATVNSIGVESVPAVTVC